MKISRTPKNKTRNAISRHGQEIESLEARQMMAADVFVDPTLNAGGTEAAFVAAPMNESGTPAENGGALAETSSTLSAMKAVVESTGELALNKIDQLAVFAGITIEAPTIGMDGSVIGTTQFGNAEAPVLLQYVAESGDWVLAVKSQLGELLPSDSSMGLPVDLSIDSPVESPLELQSPIFVFSPAELQLDSEDMSVGTRSFYQKLYESEDFTVRLERGVNLLSLATITDDSPVADILDTLGVDVPAIELEGVILRDFTSNTVEEFKQAKKDGNFWSRFREDMMLRATLPEINIKGLPNNFTTGDAFIAWQSPGTDQDYVYGGMDLIVHNESGAPTLLTGRVGFAETATGQELRMSATATNMDDAFGLTGFDLHEVTLLLDIDTVKTPPTSGDNANISTDSVPTLGLGVSASMSIGDRDVFVAGKVDLNLLTGTPMKVAVRGELSSLSSTDLFEFANRLSGLPPLASTDSNLPEIEFRNLMINIAPLGGDATLGIEDGIGVRGELYINGKLIGKADGLIDRTGITPKIRLSGWVHELDLGALQVSEVEIDILMTQSIDDHYILKGSVDFLGVSHSVDIHMAARNMHYRISTEVDGLGLVDYAFSSSTIGIPQWTFTAVVRNDLSHTLEDKVAGDIKAWAQEASEDFDKAQANLDAALRSLKSVEEERDAAIDEAQREFDKIKSGLDVAQSAVDSLASRVSSLRRSESSARSRWLSAVRSRKSAKWYNYAQRRATEIARYATYRAIQGSRVAVQGSLAAASATLGGVKAAAGWALDAAGPEAHPKVVGLTIELAAKTAALHVARAAVTAAEAVSIGAADAAAFIAEKHDDIFMIDQISFDGTLSAALIDSSFDLQVDFRFLNKEDRLVLETPTLDFDEIAAELLGHIRSLG